MHMKTNQQQGFTGPCNPTAPAGESHHAQPQHGWVLRPIVYLRKGIAYTNHIVSMCENKKKYYSATAKSLHQTEGYAKPK